MFKNIIIFIVFGAMSANCLAQVAEGTEPKNAYYVTPTLPLFPFSPPIYRHFQEGKRQAFIYSFPGVVTPSGILEYDIKPTSGTMIGVGMQWIDLYFLFEFDLLKIKKRRLWVQGKVGFYGQSYSLLHQLKATSKTNLAAGLSYHSYVGSVSDYIVARFPGSKIFALSLTGNHRLNEYFFINFAFALNTARLAYNSNIGKYTDKDRASGHLRWLRKDGYMLGVGLGVNF